MNEQLPEPIKFRERIIREDDLLNSRTTVFLITNGLLLTTVGITGDELFRMLISVLGFLVTISWVIFSWQNWKVIKNLTIEYRKHYKSDYIEEIVQNSMFKPGWRRPTDLIAKVLPMVFLLTWIAVLVGYGWRLT